MAFYIVTLIIFRSLQNNIIRERGERDSIEIDLLRYVYPYGDPEESVTVDNKGNKVDLKKVDPKDKGKGDGTPPNANETKGDTERNVLDVNDTHGGNNKNKLSSGQPAKPSLFGKKNNNKGKNPNKPKPKGNKKVNQNKKQNMLENEDDENEEDNNQNNNGKKVPDSYVEEESWEREQEEKERKKKMEMNLFRSIGNTNRPNNEVDAYQKKNILIMEDNIFISPQNKVRRKTYLKNPQKPENIIDIKKNPAKVGNKNKKENNIDNLFDYNDDKEENEDVEAEPQSENEESNDNKDKKEEDYEAYFDKNIEENKSDDMFDYNKESDEEKNARLKNKKSNNFISSADRKEVYLYNGEVLGDAVYTFNKKVLDQSIHNY